MPMPKPTRVRVNKVLRRDWRGRPLEASKSSILDEVVLKFGVQRELAKKLGISNQRFQNWRQRGRVPPEWVIPLEKATGVSRHTIRPDIYPVGV